MRTEALWYARSPTRARLADLLERLRACLEAGAAAAACELEYLPVEEGYEDVLDNRTILDRYLANARALGRDPRPEHETAIVGSTDMGNVSYLVPAIHPMVKAAPEETAIHTEDFATCAGGPPGDEAVLAGAKAMAMTLVDCWTLPGLLESAAAELAAATATP